MVRDSRVPRPATPQNRWAILMRTSTTSAIGVPTARIAKGKADPSRSTMTASPRTPISWRQRPAGISGGAGRGPSAARRQRSVSQHHRDRSASRALWQIRTAPTEAGAAPPYPARHACSCRNAATSSWTRAHYTSSAPLFEGHALTPLEIVREHRVQLLGQRAGRTRTRCSPRCAQRSDCRNLSCPPSPTVRRPPWSSDAASCD